MLDDPDQGWAEVPQGRGRGVGPSPDASTGKGCKGAKDGKANDLHHPNSPTIQPSPARRDFAEIVEKRIGFSFSTKSRNQLRGPKPPPAQQPTIHPSPARRDFVEKINVFFQRNQILSHRHIVISLLLLLLTFEGTFSFGNIWSLCCGERSLFVSSAVWSFVKSKCFVVCFCVSRVVVENGCI